MKTTVLIVADVYRKKQMCQFQELAVNEAGYVIRCAECRHYQVFYNNSIISLTQPEFETWLRQINYIAAQPGQMEDDQKRTVVLPTPKAGVHLYVTPFELIQLKLLMDAADDEVKALALIQLFHTA